MEKATKKLYYTDSYIKCFSATVQSCTKEGELYKTVLDQTAFFPEGGGQKSDTGHLGDAIVYDVQIQNGVICHFTDKPLGGTLTGEIDFEKRFRNMQHHTAEHILSGIIYKEFGLNNVGFHLSDTYVTFDTSGILSEAELKRVELLANKAVFENRAVTCFFPSEDELKNTFYRSKNEIEGEVRLVTIDSVDCCACCAPHVKYTGEIGLIKLLKTEKLRGGLRIYISCGLDALLDYRQKQESCAGISALLAAKQDEIYPTVVKLTEVLKEQKRIIAEYEKERLISLVGGADKESFNCYFVKDADVSSLRSAVNEAKKSGHKLCAVFKGDDTAGYSYVLGGSLSAKEIADKMHSALGGKGGGSEQMMQGSITAQKKDIKEFFKTL